MSDFLSDNLLFNNLDEIEQKYNIKFKAHELQYKEKILNIFNENLHEPLNDDLTNGNILNIFGLHLYCIKQNYDKMKSYYLMSAKLSNSSATHNLAKYYSDIKDYDNMIKYYLTSITNNDENSLASMHDLKQQVSAFELYNILSNVSNKNEIITNEISQLENIKYIKYHIEFLKKTYRHTKIN